MKTILSIITVAMIAMTSLQAAEAPAEAKKTSAALISAIASNDYAEFQANGDEEFVKALTKELFDEVHLQLSPKLKAGYEIIYVTNLNRQGLNVTLWKLTFKDGGDDAIATLTMRNGKIAGFIIQ